MYELMKGLILRMGLFWTYFVLNWVFRSMICDSIVRIFGELNFAFLASSYTWEVRTLGKNDMFSPTI